MKSKKLPYVFTSTTSKGEGKQLPLDIDLKDFCNTPTNQTKEYRNNNSNYSSRNPQENAPHYPTQQRTSAPPDKYASKRNNIYDDDSDDELYPCKYRKQTPNGVERTKNETNEVADNKILRTVTVESVTPLKGQRNRKPAAYSLSTLPNKINQNTDILFSPVSNLNYKERLNKSDNYRQNFTSFDDDEKNIYIGRQETNRRKEENPSRSREVNLNDYNNKNNYYNSNYDPNYGNNSSNFNDEYNISSDLSNDVNENENEEEEQIFSPNNTIKYRTEKEAWQLIDKLINKIKRKSPYFNDSDEYQRAKNRTTKKEPPLNYRIETKRYNSKLDDVDVDVEYLSDVDDCYTNPNAIQQERYFNNKYNDNLNNKYIDSLKSKYNDSANKKYNSNYNRKYDNDGSCNHKNDNLCKSPNNRNDSKNIQNFVIFDSNSPKNENNRSLSPTSTHYSPKLQQMKASYGSPSTKRSESARKRTEAYGNPNEEIQHETGPNFYSRKPLNSPSSRTTPKDTCFYSNHNPSFSPPNKSTKKVTGNVGSEQQRKASPMNSFSPKNRETPNESRAKRARKASPLSPNRSKNASPIYFSSTNRTSPTNDRNKGKSSPEQKKKIIYAEAKIQTEGDFDSDSW